MTKYYIDKKNLAIKRVGDYLKLIVYDYIYGDYKVLDMKKTPSTYRMTAMRPMISPLIIDSYLGFKLTLIVCKRLRTEVARRLLSGFKRLVKDRNIDNQGFKEFDTVAPIGELWE